VREVMAVSFMKLVSPTYELGGVCRSRLTRHGLEAGAVCHGREMNDPMPGVESPSRAGGEEE
jgi:hypothetical protein